MIATLAKRKGKVKRHRKGTFSITHAEGFRIHPPLGEFIVRHMIQNFDLKLFDKVPKEIIRDYDNVRPALDIFDWVEIISKKYDIGIDLLEMLIDEFLEIMRTFEVKKWMKNNYPFWSKFSKLFLNELGGIKLGEIIVRSVMNFRKIKKTDYLSKKAKKIFKNKIVYNDYLAGYDYKNDIETVDGVIMGHIHRNKFKIFNISDKPKYYINCGSWKPVVERINGKKFHRKSELFYALLTVGSDIEIVTSTVNVLRKREVIV